MPTCINLHNIENLKKPKIRTFEVLKYSKTFKPIFRPWSVELRREMNTDRSKGKLTVNGSAPPQPRVSDHGLGPP